ncbi:MAG: SOS response-associated peptidase [Patescibacteria group bacterium]
MCVRIYLVEADSLEKNFNLTKLDDLVSFRLKHLAEVGSNLSPDHSQFIIYKDIDSKLNKIELAKWGLVPSFSKALETGYNMVNTRIESIIEKPYFKRLSHRKRCIIPINGYYEWQGEKGNKTPFAIYNSSTSNMYLAGLYDVWQSADGDEVISFSIITKPADADLDSIHERMPLVMDLNMAKKWIDYIEDKEMDELLKSISLSKRFAKDFSNLTLKFQEIDKSVNNPQNEKFDIRSKINK